MSSRNLSFMIEESVPDLMVELCLLANEDKQEKFGEFHDGFRGLIVNQNLESMIAITMPENKK
jgi:hypothetical protein